MSTKYGVSSSSTRITWRKEHRRFRTGRLRLHVCMLSLMLFVSVSVVCAAILFKNSFRFHPSKYELNKGDIRAVEVSTLFCEGIVVKKADFNRRIMVVSPAKRHKATKWSVSSHVVLLRYNRYWYRSFYLLKGSVVKMRLTSHHSLRLFWLKGRENLDKWTKETSKVLKQSFRTPTEKHTETIMDDTFTVNDDNNYYLGFKVIAGDTNYTEVFINFTVSRVVYDTSFYTAACNASAGRSCHVRLRFNSYDTAVIEVEDKTDVYLLDVWTVWYCQPRVWIYLSIFGGIFVLGIFVLFLVYICVMSKVNKKVPKRKPSQIPLRTESFNPNVVVLQSISTTNGPSNHVGENSTELTPLTLIPNNLPNEHESEDEKVDETAIDNSTTALRLMESMNETDQDVDSPLWQTTPSPRWSTFLHDPDLEYEECTTDFREYPKDTPELEDNLDFYNSEEGDRLGKELAERLQRLKAENILYEGPEETDIDSSDEEFQNDSELEPLTNGDDMDSEHDTTTSGSKTEAEVVKRRKERRREQRWEPRLSMVTEV